MSLPIVMKKILIIDADQCVRELLTIMLEKENYIPVSAADARSGYDLAAAIEEIASLSDELKKQND